MKGNLICIPVYILLAVLSCSCTSPRKILYFQDIGDKKDLQALANYEPTIKPNDMLTIIVSAPNKDVVTPYNILLGESLSTSDSSIPYLVDAEGFINFPLLGQVRVKGLTLKQLTDRLTEEISKDVKNPVVNISYHNYRVTILGEVGAPGTYTIPDERTTIIQALGMAGDLTITAKRNDILLIRENDGKFEYAQIDIRKSELLTSPYYFLNQNDIIYVSPSRRRISSATSPASTIALITSTLSIITTIFLIVREF